MRSLSANTKHLVLAYYNRHYKYVLSDLLHVYGNVSLRTLATISQLKISGVDNDTLVITFAVPGVPSPIDKVIIIPELADNSNASVMERLNKMIIDAAAKRQLSIVQVKKSLAPSTIADILVLLAVPLPLVCYFYRPLLHYIPIIGSLLYDKDNYLLIIIALELCIHMCESIVFLRPKLRYYRVPTDCQIEYYFWGILEGYSPVRRLNQYGTPLEAATTHKLLSMKQIDMAN